MPFVEPEACYWLYNGMVDSVLNQMNPVDSCTPRFLEIHFSSANPTTPFVKVVTQLVVQSEVLYSFNICLIRATCSAYFILLTPKQYSVKNMNWLISRGLCNLGYGVV